ncbi:MAG: DNA-directed RNA polymerase subunit D [Candidatus Diapherotrites archaeon]|uniref:DNA-directed RNA polymerase subunit Rpo3 n=1 Tax=Candidatus Iainarchaeum sp. TaxID=3101447 RepID=A0A7K4BYU5_9ARCH|nr:DNA-directed RNA polymerase subunit D [Candidatus Diapherotrites archaeon]
MDIKKVYEEGSVTKYLIKGTTPTFMNTLRRTIMTEVPCLAIEEVSFYENTGIIFDEMLANRLGLLPIKTDTKAYKRGDKVKLVLEKEGPGIVTTKDIKCTDPKIEILDKKIYITKLVKDQKLRLEMTALMESGTKHAKFQPAIVSYNEVPYINNDKIDTKNLKEIVESAPKGSIELKAGKLFLTDPYNTKIQNQPVDILEKYGAKINYSEDEFVLTIETTGQLTTQEIIESAIKEITTKLEEIEEGIKKL